MSITPTAAASADSDGSGDAASRSLPHAPCATRGNRVVRWLIPGLTLALMLVAGSLTWTVREQMVTKQRGDTRIRELVGIIRHLDEVLTMSARMAAASSEPRWMDRYAEFEPALDAAIKELLVLSPTAFDTQVGRETDAANQRLVAMERASFELIRDGKPAEARHVLFSDAYEHDKLEYAKGMSQTESLLKANAEREEATLQFRAWTLAICVSVALAVLLTGWWRSARYRTRAEREFARQRLEFAEAATYAKSQFLASMSHEIRTPMTAILGYADLLADKDQDLQHRLEYARIIQRNGDHLLSIVNDILDISKIEAGKLLIERVACSPVQLLHDLLSLSRVRATVAGNELTLRIASPPPESITTDPVRLRQILLNLVGNAIKFTDRGRIEVTVSTLPQSGTGANARPPRLVFEVRDTGIGMSPEQLGKLFQPFSQADASMSRRFGGTGLGLCISRRLSEMLGGTLHATSELGVGSVFTLELVITAEEAARTLDDEESLESVRTAGRAGTANDPSNVPTALHGRILLAEDGPDNQRLIAFHLTKAGARVALADNGREAVDRALAAERGLDAEGPFDLILMDMQMPELDGYSATLKLRQRGYRRPIVALTAHAMKGDRERCLAAGCDHYLTKPIDRAELLRICGAMTSHKSAA